MSEYKSATLGLEDVCTLLSAVLVFSESPFDQLID